MASTYLTRTASANNNSVGKWTFSCWIKRNALQVETNIISFYTDSSNRSALRFDADDKLRFYEVVSGSTVVTKLTNRLFRDPAAWYHIMLAVDKTLGSPETQIYVNGVEETSFATDDGYTQNQAGNFNQAIPIFINAESAGVNAQDICMSHVHFVDGTQYDPTTFGEFDSTTGIWKIKTSPTLTMGTNGFTILKDGNTITDQSSNSNNFSLGAGTLTPTEDCPDNVFPTMNPLLPSVSSLTFTNGNLHNGDQSPNDWQAIGATMAANAGKFYWEFKIESVWGSTSDTSQRHGVANLFATLNYNPGNGDVAWTDDPYAIGWQNSSGIRYNGGSGTMTSEFGTYVANDILMFAMDLDNKKLYFGKNGTWLNSGDPTSGSSGTGAYSMPDLGKGGIWAPYSETKYGSDKVSWNMGNGYFKTTAISSEGTNASGIGKFEYNVPTGYTALSTKGLNE